MASSRPSSAVAAPSAYPGHIPERQQHRGLHLEVREIIRERGEVLSFALRHIPDDSPRRPLAQQGKLDLVDALSPDIAPTREVTGSGGVQGELGRPLGPGWRRWRLADRWRPPVEGSPAGFGGGWRCGF